MLTSFYWIKCEHVHHVDYKHIIGLFAFRDSDQLQEQSGTNRPRTALTEEVKQRLSEEVCDTILAHNKARFTGHLVSATLVQGTMFERYCH